MSFSAGTRLAHALPERVQDRGEASGGRTRTRAADRARRRSGRSRGSSRRSRRRTPRRTRRRCRAGAEDDRPSSRTPVMPNAIAGPTQDALGMSSREGGVVEVEPQDGEHAAVGGRTRGCGRVRAEALARRAGADGSRRSSSAYQGRGIFSMLWQRLALGARLVGVAEPRPPGLSGKAPAGPSTRSCRRSCASRSAA